MGIVDTLRNFRDYALWETLRGITSQDIIRCLEGHGWVRGEGSREELLAYVAPVHDDLGREIKVIVPASLTEVGAYRVAGAIEWVALVAGMTVPEVMAELRDETPPERPV